MTQFAWIALDALGHFRAVLILDRKANAPAHWIVYNCVYITGNIHTGDLNSKVWEPTLNDKIVEYRARAERHGYAILDPSQMPQHFPNWETAVDQMVFWLTLKNSS